MFAKGSIAKNAKPEMHISTMFSFRPKQKIKQPAKSKEMPRRLANPFFIPFIPRKRPDTSIPEAQTVSVIPRVLESVKDKTVGSARIWNTPIKSVIAEEIITRAKTPFLECTVFQPNFMLSRIVVAFRDSIRPIFAFENTAFAGDAAWKYPYMSMAFTIVILVAGSTMVMWLAERITEHGIANGSSIIIFIGILATAGTTMAKAFKMVGTNWTYIWNIIGYILVVVAVFVFIVFIDGSERRITVQYSKQVKGNKMYGGQTTYIPIRVNGSGVMPIIFASSLIMFPQMIISLFFSTTPAASWYARYLGSGTPVYYVALALFILAFSYFYAQIQFNPEDVARNIQQYGGFIPGIRAGKPTMLFLKKINNRITLFGAVFLMIIALVPTFIFAALAGQYSGYDLGFNNAFSATGLLIVVSVALEINKQLESQIMMKHYKGFLK